MRATFIGHSSILVETKGLRILSDPWWQGACFGSQWWLYPKADLASVEAGPIDYIYISHGHADHLHRGTLRRFPAGTKVLVSSELDLAPGLKDMGFEVITVKPDEVLELGGGVTCCIVPTYADDTLMVIADGQEVCINLNDALHSAPESVQKRFTDWLRLLYGTPDYVFCGYGTASHFPNCYVIPGKDPVRTAARRQQHFNQAWARIVGALAPRFAFPFAASVVFFDEALMWCNEPVHNSERPTDAFRALFPLSSTQAIDIGHGFVIEDGKILRDIRFKPVSNTVLAQECADEIRRANQISLVSVEDFDHVFQALRRNVGIAERYLKEFSGNYDILIKVDRCPEGAALRKRGRNVQLEKVKITGTDGAYDLVFSTRFSYLRRALSEKYGHETLFVGSGCRFEYKSLRLAKLNLHRELTPILRLLEAQPRSRFGDQPKALFVVKSLAKRMLHGLEEDLYDLATWSEMVGSDTPPPPPFTGTGTATADRRQDEEVGVS